MSTSVLEFSADTKPIGAMRKRRKFFVNGTKGVTVTFQYSRTEGFSSLQHFCTLTGGFYFEFAAFGQLIEHIIDIFGLECCDASLIKINLKEHEQTCVARISTNIVSDGYLSRIKQRGLKM